MNVQQNELNLGIKCWRCNYVDALQAIQNCSFSKIFSPVREDFNPKYQICTACSDRHSTNIWPRFNFTLLESSHPEHVKQWSRQQKFRTKSYRLLNHLVHFVRHISKKIILRRVNTLHECLQQFCDDYFFLNTLVRLWSAARIFGILYIMPSQNFMRFHVFRLTSNKFDTFDLIIQWNKL